MKYYLNAIVQWITEHPYWTTFWCVVLLFVLWLANEFRTAPMMPEYEEKYYGESDSSYPNEEASETLCSCGAGDKKCGIKGCDGQYE